MINKEQVYFSFRIVSYKRTYSVKTIIIFLICQNPSKERRKDINCVNRKLENIYRLKKYVQQGKVNFNKGNNEMQVITNIKEYVQAINNYVDAIDNILQTRLIEIQSLKFEDSHLINQVKMSEIFDLKTAASLVPIMDGSEDYIKQRIDAMELYDSLLDDNIKKLLIIHVLKTRASENVKI